MTSSPTRWYRPDITGLRSLAIIPVVAFHAGASAIPGGFIGVDIFYVISGFLITTLLVREVEASGRVRLGTFWAKRIRRLVPALVVTVVVTLPIAALLAPVLSSDTLAVQASASALYVANILFWRESTDYFDTGGGQSPFLHMWSLGVEEQFYVVWPLLIIAVVLIARRIPLRTRLLVVFAVVFAASLALSIGLTPVNPNAAFYLLPTRAWEFAGAGLLALLPIGALVRTRGVASVFALAGVAILIFGFIFLNETDLYPGYLALIPFVGAALILIAGAGARSVLAPLLESRPAVWVGNVSYSWYLWHWPLIVFAAALFPRSAAAMAVAGVVSLGVGALSYYFIEQPLRFRPFLAKSTLRTYLVGIGATVAVVAVAAGVYASGAALLRTEPLRTYAEAAETLPDRGCEGGVEQTYDAVQVCVLGDPGGSRTVAFIGDSHAGHWRAAMDAAAAEAGVRLIFRWKSSCPSTDVVVGDAKGVQDPGCAPYREKTDEILRTLRPDAVIISNAYAYDGKVLSADGGRIPIEQQRALWAEALDTQIATMEAAGARVALVRDNPRMLFNPTACLSRLGATASGCQSSWDDAHQLIADFAQVTDEVVSARGVPTFAIDDVLCADGYCTAVDDEGLPVYQDQTHLSEMWTQTQVPALEAFLHRVLD